MASSTSHRIHRLSQGLRLDTPQDYLENFNALRDPIKIANIIKVLYLDIMCAAQTEGGLTDWSTLHSDVR